MARTSTHRAADSAAASAADYLIKPLCFIVLLPQVIIGKKIFMLLRKLITQVEVVSVDLAIDLPLPLQRFNRVKE